MNLRTPAGVDGDRLFREHVLALLDRVGELLRAEARWRREDHVVDPAVDHLSVGVESDEALVLGNLVLGAFLGQGLARGVEAILEQVAHGDDVDQRRRLDRVARRAGSRVRRKPTRPTLMRSLPAAKAKLEPSDASVAAAAPRTEVLRKSRRVKFCSA
jgi:hypothetical protein